MQSGHVISRNYFGSRPRLGKNGGETIRIGTGKVSHQRFEMRVLNNYFEDTSGEAEIISIKSHGNIISGNMFVEAKGAVTFRQGDDNLVSRNIFLGGGVKSTGGVRLTSFNNQVKDNYFEGLVGENGSSALTFMNGLSDSADPLPLYKQVQKAVIENNSFINSSHMTFGLVHRERKDQTFTPQDSVIRGNLVTHTDGGPTEVVSHADMSEVAFSGNVGALKGGEGFASVSAFNQKLVRGENGLYYPQYLEIGAPRNLSPFRREDIGPSYFEFPKR